MKIIITQNKLKAIKAITINQIAVEKITHFFEASSKEWCVEVTTRDSNETIGEYESCEKAKEEFARLCEWFAEGEESIYIVK